MERWLRVTGNDHGEWSVLDLERNYRVCAFNHVQHAGVHVHHEGEWEPVDLETLGDAQQMVRRYAKDHETFDREKFEEVLKEWKSGSSTE